ncbi:cytochrome P450 [Mycena leptocephala]|nr:cytochrome P450 [Mycena leptocephala]
MASTSVIILASLAGVLLLTVVILHRLAYGQQRILPPGPAGWPVIGNILDMPTATEWLTFAQWGSKWVLHRWNVLCDSSWPAHCDPKLCIGYGTNRRQGSVFSTRPRLPMAGELLGYAQTLVLMPYGARFRTFRKHFAKLLGTPAAMHHYLPVVETETRRFLTRLLSRPNSDDINQLTGRIILRITYGIEVQEDQDPFVSLIQAAKVTTISMPPRRQATRIWALATRSMVEAPYSFVRRQMSTGRASICFVSSLLEDEELTQEEANDVKYTASSLYGGGADTTAASLYAFFLAMVLTPDVQHKAQAEIDSIIGDTRLPAHSDREQLPYVSAVVTELFRWHSVAPLGVPHATLEDTVVGGYLIPKGTIVIAKLWNMLNDPEIYPCPATFDRSVTWGPRHSVTPALYASGSGGGHPKLFHCVVKPRSDRAVALISGEPV